MATLRPTTRKCLCYVSRVLSNDRRTEAGKRRFMCRRRRFAATVGRLGRLCDLSISGAPRCDCQSRAGLFGRKGLTVCVGNM